MKTVKVRIAVAIDRNTLEWNSSGWSRAQGDEAMEFAVDPLEPGEHRCWIEAEIEVPEIPVIEGSVSE